MYSNNKICMRICKGLVVLYMAASSPGYAINFEDVSSQAGMLFPEESWGSAWGDFDGDLYPDLWSSNHRGTPTLYRNNKNGTFTNIINQVFSGNPDTDAHGSAWADFDRDGDQDLLEQVGGSNAANPNNLNQFYIQGNGVLSEQADARGVQYGEHRGRSVLWFDYDSDGQLDLSLTGFTDSSLADPSAVFRNESGNFVEKNTQTGFDCPLRSNFSTLADVSGDGRLDLICHGFTFPQKVYDISTVPFTDITSTFPKTSLVFDSVFADFNGDLQIDLLSARIPGNRSNAVQVSDFVVQSRLVGQNGSERGFSFNAAGNLDIDITSPTLTAQTVYIGASGLHPVPTGGVTHVELTLSSSNPDHIGIFPHDTGDRGLYIGYNTATSSWDLTIVGPEAIWSSFESENEISNLTLVGFQPTVGNPLRLYGSSPSGYVNDSVKAGFTESTYCVSITAGDFDNDMDVDAYLVCEQSPVNLPNRLYENIGDTNDDGVPEFVLVPNAGGASGSTIGMGKNVAMADYDLDGFLDLYVTNGHSGGSVPNGPDQLFRNTGNSNNWIEIDLIGVQSNIHGIGARIIATTADGTKQLREQAGGSHTYTQNHQRIHFGLAGHNKVDIQITWPSGLIETFRGLSANSLHQLREGDALPKSDSKSIVSSILLLLLD